VLDILVSEVLLVAWWGGECLGFIILYSVYQKYRNEFR